MARADYRVAALAGHCNITERQLRRYVRLKFGKTPHAWLTEERLARATELLAHGALVKETAAETGFKQPGHFSRVFKKHFKRNPRSDNQK